MENEKPNLEHLNRVMHLGDEVTGFNINGKALIRMTARKSNESGSKMELFCEFLDEIFYQAFLTHKGPRHPLSPLVESVIDSDSPQG